MCGRTACTLAPDELCRACRSDNLDVGWRDHPGNQHNYSPSYNVAPTMHTPVIFSAKQLKSLTDEEPATDYIIQPMMWNLVPHFHKGDNAKSHGYKTNNCRVESVQDKQMFAHLLKKGQRCVVLCDGFYEWQTTTKDKSKAPYLVYGQQADHVRIWDRSSWEGKTSVSVHKDKVSTEDNVSSNQNEGEKRLSTNGACDSKVLGNVADKDSVDAASGDHNKDSSTVKNEVPSSEPTAVSDAMPGNEPHTVSSKTSEAWHGPSPLKMAGLFSKWTSSEKEEVWSYTVLTTESGPNFSWLHHRVPVILSTEEQIKSWLEPATPLSTVLANVGSRPPLQWHAVTSQVNNSRNNLVTCMQPATEKKAVPKSASSQLMTSWLSKGKRKDGDQHLKAEKKAKLQ